MAKKKDYGEILPAFHREEKVLKALANRKRQYILTLLCHHWQGMTVGALTKQLGITQPAISHHLQILRNAQLVTYRRKGLESEYYLTCDVPLRTLISDLQEVGRTK